MAAPRPPPPQIDESLSRLQTDRIDLMQYHENIRMEDPDRFFDDGAVDALLEAKKAGKIRYIGFTGHKDPLVHLRMLEGRRRTVSTSTPRRCRSTSWTPSFAASRTWWCPSWWSRESPCSA